MLSSKLIRPAWPQGGGTALPKWPLATMGLWTKNASGTASCLGVHWKNVSPNRLDCTFVPFRLALQDPAPESLILRLLGLSTSTTRVFEWDPFATKGVKLLPKCNFLGEKFCSDTVPGELLSVENSKV